MQAHMNEYAGEVNYTLEQYRKRPVEYLEELGALGAHFVAAHGILLSAREQKLLAQAGAKVVHCPFSNCGKGVPKIRQASLERGVCVGLGTDGAAHGGLSLWNEMRIFRSVMNAVRGVQNADPACDACKNHSFHGSKKRCGNSWGSGTPRGDKSWIPCGSDFH